MRDILEPLRIALGDTTAFGLAVVLTAGDCRKAIDEIEQLRQRISALEAEKAERERELAAVKSVLHDEIDANLAFRDACGASDDEDMPTFCARIVFELRELRTRMAERERQEPVAWQGVHDTTDLYFSKPVQGDVRPLYAHPLALREPTDEECAAIHQSWLDAHGIEGIGCVLNGRAMFNAVREVMTK